MIQEYIQKAMEAAHYEMLEEDEGFYGEIPGATGVWATGRTLESCRQELKSGHLLHSGSEGQHSELTVISGDRLDQLRDFCIAAIRSTKI
ncbi:type II toxin-antitoxin system HicB family antitoxin [Aerosakkonemataceae cyanobacterium BLCC-F154]|uniref:Type II toxin-antitoxin system HicB family antitoxin n=1 Tax=Floridaenema fluviatile BLCC-F154 TaxID=3153640 RepID=A0ABV4Y5T4_9CYAN